LQTTDKYGEGVVTKFPNGKQQIEFEEFIDVIRDACIDSESAENYLVLAFSMFDIEK
jgi:Ca2+-binding EF-hand superfamily protein